MLDRNLVIVWANDAYIRVTMRRREILLGQNMFDAFPSDPESESHQLLRRSFQTVLRTGTQDEIALIRYDIAKADGRWAAAYAPIRNASEASIPDDLRAAIKKSPKAFKIYKTLSRMNFFAMTFRVNNMKTAAGRTKKIAALVAMLERGETLVPNKGREAS